MESQREPYGLRVGHSPKQRRSSITGWKLSSIQRRGRSRRGGSRPVPEPHLQHKQRPQQVGVVAASVFVLLNQVLHEGRRRDSAAVEFGAEQVIADELAE